MPYEQQSWVDKPDKSTPITAARLAHMEGQYDAAVEDLRDGAETLDTFAKVETAIEGVADDLADLADAGLTYGKNGTTYRIVAGCLRRIDASTWGVLNDSGHAPTGIASVTIEGSNRVRVTYDFTATKVVTWSSTLDEAFASSTVMLRQGASVGTSYAEIYFYTDSGGSTPIDPGTLSTSNANVWVYGLFEVS